MKRLCCVVLSPLLAISVCGQVASLDKSPVRSARVAAMVDSLYKEVVVRHPIGTPDRKVFGPYLSKGLLHRFDRDDTCFARWRRANPDPNFKPDFGLLELRVFSGGTEDAEPQVFHIEKVGAEKDGSYRVTVKFTQSEVSYKQIWYGAVIVIFENGRPVVDDLVFLKFQDLDEERLSNILFEDCKLH